MMYKVAKASEYLVITGVGIRDIKLAKKSWVFPGQSCTVLDLSPVNYTFNKLQVMSAEKLIFQLTAVFTIGPNVVDKQSLIKYAKLFSSHKKLLELVQGIVEGETRVLAASMTMEEIFRGSKSFKQQVFDKVQLELNQFGLLIYNANVKQLVDVAGHEYFSYLSQKSRYEAANKVKVEVAEANMKGDIEALLRQGQTLKYAAMIDANVHHINCEISKKKTAAAQAAYVAQVEAAKAVALRDAELQRQVEKINTLTITEKRKIEFLGRASIEYQLKLQEANWELYKKQKAAEAALFEKEKEAEAKRALAQAELFAKKEEAKGMVALGEAHGAYLKALLDAMGGNYANLKDYLMIDRGLVPIPNITNPVSLIPQQHKANNNTNI